MKTDLLCHRDEMNRPLDERVPKRPLGHVSDFVALNLPLVIQDTSLLPEQQQLAHFCEEARTRLADMPSRGDVRLALLDAALLEQAYARHCDQVPAAIHDLTDACRDQIGATLTVSGLTYEGIIYANPLGDDPRLFSEGEHARAELLFYEVHRRIERHIAQTVIELKRNSEQPFESLHRAIDALKGGFRSLLQELEPAEFAAFRGYFQNAHRGLPGPSGLFSAGVAVLDEILAGSANGISHLQHFKMRKRHLYPSTTASDDSFCGQSDMEHAATSPMRDLLLCEQYPASDRSEIARHMQDAREMHVRIAERFIPEAFAGGTKGTAGTASLESFLRIAGQAYGDLSRMIPLLSSLHPPLSYGKHAR